MTIGRDSNNWICITDLSASRKHCMITRAGETLKVTDLESRNGTSICGIPIRERILQNGDQIEIGDSVFLLLLHPEERLPSHVNEDDVAAIPTTRLRVEDAVYLQPEKLRVNKWIIGKEIVKVILCTEQIAKHCGQVILTS